MTEVDALAKADLRWGRLFHYLFVSDNLVHSAAQALDSEGIPHFIGRQLGFRFYVIQDTEASSSGEAAVKIDAPPMAEESKTDISNVSFENTDPTPSPMADEVFLVSQATIPTVESEPSCATCTDLKTSKAGASGELSSSAGSLNTGEGENVGHMDNISIKLIHNEHSLRLGHGRARSQTLGDTFVCPGLDSEASFVSRVRSLSQGEEYRNETVSTSPSPFTVPGLDASDMGLIWELSLWYQHSYFRFFCLLLCS